MIHEVRAGHPVPGFLSILKLYILKPFHFETDSDSPAVKWNISMPYLSHENINTIISGVLQH